MRLMLESKWARFGLEFGREQPDDEDEIVSNEGGNFDVAPSGDDDDDAGAEEGFGFRGHRRG